MDSLDTLPPVSSTTITPQEHEVFSRYFKTPDSSSGSDVSTFKLVLYTTFLFLLLGNQWVDSVISLVPTTNGLIHIGIKCLLFALTFFLMYKYCM